MYVKQKNTRPRNPSIFPCTASSTHLYMHTLISASLKKSKFSGLASANPRGSKFFELGSGPSAPRNLARRFREKGGGDGGHTSDTIMLRFLVPKDEHVTNIASGVCAQKHPCRVGVCAALGQMRLDLVLKFIMFEPKKLPKEARAICCLGATLWERGKTCMLFKPRYVLLHDNDAEIRPPPTPVQQHPSARGLMLFLVRVISTLNTNWTREGGSLIFEFKEQNR